MAEKKTRFCAKCRKTMDTGQFYSSWNLEKYPEGFLNECKKCIAMHVDNFNPDTYTWILQECDVPYLPEEWSNLLLKYARDPSKITGVTILGRYLAKMRLKQFKEFRWKDSDFLIKAAEERLSSDMKRQGYGAAEIAQALQEAADTVSAANAAKELIKAKIKEEELESEDISPSIYSALGDQSEDYFAIQNGADDFQNDLTDEDKTYLRLKWGKSYKPEEWIRLEQLYEEMTQSYDIQGAAHEDNLKLLCKTSLKANQLIDIGD